MSVLHVCCIGLHKPASERCRQGPTGAYNESSAESRKRLLISGFPARRAEGEGFEPSVRLTTYNGFRDRPVQPLRHPSEGLTMIGAAS
jgi:hypothetical protein